jgi:hypothetical protein
LQLAYGTGAVNIKVRATLLVGLVKYKTIAAAVGNI